MTGLASTGSSQPPVSASSCCCLLVFHWYRLSRVESSKQTFSPPNSWLTSSVWSGPESNQCFSATYWQWFPPGTEAWGGDWRERLTSGHMITQDSRATAPLLSYSHIYIYWFSLPDNSFLQMDNLRQTFTDASSLLSKAVKVIERIWFFLLKTQNYIWPSQDTNLQDEASVVFNRAKQVSCLCWPNFLIIQEVVNIYSNDI